MSAATRRAVLVLGVVAVFAVTSAPPVGAASAPPSVPRARTPIQHVVSVMQESHSFDNYFGTYPGANGIPPRTCMSVTPGDTAAGCVKPFVVGDQPTLNLGHSRTVFQAEYANGALNGFVSAFSTRGVTSDIAMGHYVDKDIPFYWNLADHYVLFDRYFASAGGGTLWNHMYWVTGTSGNPAGEDVPTAGVTGNVPTIFDELARAGISWKFYVQGYDPGDNYQRPPGKRGSQVTRVPLLDLPRVVSDPATMSHIVPIEQYYTDLQHGTLPAVSYIVPSGSSEQPPGKLQAGTRFVQSIVGGLEQSSAWSSSALLLTYDSWGGWYDHVAPPQVDGHGLGFRVPSLLVSPYAREGQVNHTQLEHSSVLKFIEGNWGLAALSSRDATANDFRSAFDFTRPPRRPELVGSERGASIAKQPRESAIYAVYFGAFGVCVSLIAFAVWSRRRRAGAG